MNHTELSMFVSILIKGDPEKRIDIPVNINKIDDTFCQRLQEISSDTVKIWAWGGLAGPEYIKSSIDREAELLGRTVEIHPPMSFDEHECHRE